MDRKTSPCSVVTPDTMDEFALEDCIEDERPRPADHAENAVKVRHARSQTCGVARARSPQRGHHPAPGGIGASQLAREHFPRSGAGIAICIAGRRAARVLYACAASAKRNFRPDPLIYPACAAAASTIVTPHSDPSSAAAPAVMSQTRRNALRIET